MKNNVQSFYTHVILFMVRSVVLFWYLPNAFYLHPHLPPGNTQNTGHNIHKYCTLTNVFLVLYWIFATCLGLALTHFLVKNGCFSQIISPSKYVVSIGYSWKQSLTIIIIKKLIPFKVHIGNIFSLFCSLFYAKELVKSSSNP